MGHFLMSADFTPETGFSSESFRINTLQPGISIAALSPNRLLYAARKGKKMKVKLLRVLAAAILLAAASLAGPSIAQAVVIHILDVDVSIHVAGGPPGSGNDFCGVAGCPNGTLGFTPHTI